MPKLLKVQFFSSVAFYILSSSDFIFLRNFVVFFKRYSIHPVQNPTQHINGEMFGLLQLLLDKFLFFFKSLRKALNFVLSASRSFLLKFIFNFAVE
ncbi:unnamed protein product [Ixodes pacificus]